MTRNSVGLNPRLLGMIHLGETQKREQTVLGKNSEPREDRNPGE